MSQILSLIKLIRFKLQGDHQKSQVAVPVTGIRNGKKIQIRDEHPGSYFTISKSLEAIFWVKNTSIL